MYRIASGALKIATSDCNPEEPPGAQAEKDRALARSSIAFQENYIAVRTIQQMSLDRTDYSFAAKNISGRTIGVPVT